MMAKVVQVIRRWDLDDDAIKETPGGEWMLASDVDLVFPLDVPFMPVPRCEHCLHWQGPSRSGQPSSMCVAIDGSGGYGNEHVIVWTKPDFGCVLFTAKAESDPVP